MTTVFGRDISCTKGLRTGSYATGLRLVAEAAYRRLTTPRGMLRGGEAEQNYGIDLAELIGESTSTTTAATLQGRIQAELMKDDRIESVTVDVATTKSGPATTYTIAVVAVTAEGPFTLTIAASAVTVALLGIEVG